MAPLKRMYGPDTLHFKPVARLLNSLSERCRRGSERSANKDGLLFEDFALKMFHGNLGVDMIKHFLGRIDFFRDTIGEAPEFYLLSSPEEGPFGRNTQFGCKY